MKCLRFLWYRLVWWWYWRDVVAFETDCGLPCPLLGSHPINEAWWRYWTPLLMYGRTLADRRRLKAATPAERWARLLLVEAARHDRSDR